MVLGRLQLEGFRHPGRDMGHVADGGRVALLAPGVEGAGVADAIELLAMALAPDRAVPGARRLGWWSEAAVVAGLDDGTAEVELHGLRPVAVGAVVAPEARALTIEGTLQLDPVLYGRLREQAARDPRVVLALGQEPVVRVKAGWLFSLDRTTARPSILHFRIGDTGFDPGGKERPLWLPELLAEMGRRFHRTDPFESPAVVGERLLRASLSPDPAVREGYRALLRTLVGAPFALPEPGLVQEDGPPELAFGPELWSIRQMGREALDALRWAEAAYVRRPDVLVLDEPAPSEAVRQWWTALVDSDGAPVEQVWLR